MYIKNGGGFFLGNVSTVAGELHYGFVPPCDKRILRFANPSVAEVVLSDCKRRFGGSLRLIMGDTGDAPVREKRKPYAVVDGRLDKPLFEGERDEVYNWIIDGLRGTQGAERDHYVSLLLQLEGGKKMLDYNLDA